MANNIIFILFSLTNKVSDYLVNLLEHLAAKKQIFPSVTGGDQTLS